MGSSWYTKQQGLYLKNPVGLAVGLAIGLLSFYRPVTEGNVRNIGNVGFLEKFVGN